MDLVQWSPSFRPPQWTGGMLIRVGAYMCGVGLVGSLVLPSPAFRGLDVEDFLVCGRGMDACLWGWFRFGSIWFSKM